MESFHVNANTDLDMFRFCLIYLLWSQYFLGKKQILFHVRFSPEESWGREESFSWSPLYSFPTAPMPETAAGRPSPAASWQMDPRCWPANSCCSAEQLSKRAEGTCLQLDQPHTHAKGDPSCQMTGCALSSTENTWASWTDITSLRDEKNSRLGWHVAQPNKVVTKIWQLVVLLWAGPCCSYTMAALTTLWP